MSITGLLIASGVLNIILIWAYWDADKHFQKVVRLCNDIMADNKKIRRECQKLIADARREMLESEDEGDAWKRQ